jgi:hypothetical protein
MHIPRTHATRASGCHLIVVCDVDIFVCGFICVQSSGHTASGGDHTPWSLLIKILS